jgi:type IV secretory pathway TraG/TraD family ATPase VirD4
MNMDNETNGELNNEESKRITSTDNDVTLFAQTNYRVTSEAKVFGVKRSDRRYHMFLLGKTGMGKSTLIENLALSDIYNSESVIVLDPHGDLVVKLLNHIPKVRQADVIYFNPADITAPIGFNILEKFSSGQEYLLASGIISIFKKLWPESWGPRLEHILRNSILTLLEFNGTTLLDLPKLLTDKQFRAALISMLSNEQLKDFWLKEFESFSPNFRSEAIAPVQNKVGQFITNPIIRAIIGQKQSIFSMRQVMDEGKILLVNLAKGRIGEDSCKLLGSLLLTSIELAALSRADIAEESNRRDCYVFIDEAHNFLTENLATVLSESRKYHVSYILASQYLEQFDEKLRAAIFGNVGTLISFRIGARDSQYLAKEFYPVFDEESLINLPPYHIYLKLMIEGVSSQPFSAVTLPSRFTYTLAAPDPDIPP